MRDPAFVLFLTAVLCVLAGMGWGIQMSVSGDHSLAAAHGHLNLVGWATLALFGIYYRLTPEANVTVLARVQAGLAILGVIVMAPGIAVVICGGPPGFAAAGSLLLVTAMALFLAIVVRHGFGAARSSAVRDVMGEGVSPDFAPG